MTRGKLAGGGLSAFVWDGTGTYDLPQLVDPADIFHNRLRGLQAIDINNKGEILVAGFLEGSSKMQAFVFTPVLQHDLKDLKLNKSEIAGCLRFDGTITLNRPAPSAGVVVALKDNIAAASTPATVKIGAGLTSAKFQVSTVPVAAARSGSVTAILGGSAMSRGLTVRPIGMQSITLNPNPVVGGNNTLGAARLECNAALGPITIRLRSSNATIAKPNVASIVVPIGARTVGFTVNTKDIASQQTVTIRGTANGVAASKALTVRP